MFVSLFHIFQEWKERGSRHSSISFQKWLLPLLFKVVLFKIKTFFDWFKCTCFANQTFISSVVFQWINGDGQQTTVIQKNPSNLKKIKTPLNPTWPLNPSCIGGHQNQKPQVEICSLTLIFFNENWFYEAKFSNY